MGDRFYITAAIDYSNGDPHLGHAYEKIGADCIARYRRLRGHQVHFLIGMDEHGQKVAQSAEAEGIDPQTWVDRIAETFQTTWKELGISNTDFIRTTQDRHKQGVETFLERLQEGGHIYEGTYSGFYCVGCEGFKLEKDLEDGHCPLHPTREIKWLEETNRFFRLSDFSQRLLELYAQDPQFVRPAPKMNEIKNLVASGLQDTSVSRARVPWGIPWPEDPSHSVYVWFDAVLNYLTAAGYPDAQYKSVWPPDLHVIGPDILRFHAALWPAMLMAADVPLPKKVWVHGWMTFSGSRFSKSAGVTLALREAIDAFGVDALRYFLLREVPWDADGNFSWERFEGRYTSELADGYGNLASRVLAMIARYRSGIVADTARDTELDRFGDEAIERYGTAMDDHLLHVGGQEAWSLVSRANGFVEESAPWTLAKENREAELDAVLSALARALARITIMASPFMPDKSQAVWQSLGFETPLCKATWPELVQPTVGNRHVNKPPPLFPKG